MQRKKGNYKIKMVVTDLDETLFRADKSISRNTIDTIQKVRKNGIRVIFANQMITMAWLSIWRISNGFIINQIVEPQPPKNMMDILDMKDEMRRPMMLIVSANKKTHYTQL